MGDMGWEVREMGAGGGGERGGERDEGPERGVEVRWRGRLWQRDVVTPLPPLFRTPRAIGPPSNPPFLPQPQPYYQPALAYRPLYPTSSAPLPQASTLNPHAPSPSPPCLQGSLLLLAPDHGVHYLVSEDLRQIDLSNDQLVVSEGERERDDCVWGELGLDADRGG